MCATSLPRVRVLLCGVVSAVNLRKPTPCCTLSCALMCDACVAWLRSLQQSSVMPRKGKRSDANKSNGAKAPQVVEAAARRQAVAEAAAGALPAAVVAAAAAPAAAAAAAVVLLSCRHCLACLAIAAESVAVVLVLRTRQVALRARRLLVRVSLSWPSSLVAVVRLSNIS